MPSTSEAQHRAMEAAAQGHSTLGIPESVGKEFVAADSLSKIRNDMEDYFSSRADAKSDEHWITTETGSHLLLNGQTVIGGAGGKLNGQVLGKTTVKPKAQKQLNEGDRNNIARSNALYEKYGSKEPGGRGIFKEKARSGELDHLHEEYLENEANIAAQQKSAKQEKNQAWKDKNLPRMAAEKIEKIKKEQEAKTEQITNFKNAVSTPIDKRNYLAVPFSDKDYAKAQGAAWDPQKKQWFVGENIPDALKTYQRKTYIEPQKQQETPAPQAATKKISLPSYGKINEDDPSIWGHQLLGYEGDTWQSFYATSAGQEFKNKFRSDSEYADADWSGWDNPDSYADSDEPKNELTTAKAIQSGELSSPQQYENIWLFDVRVTGTGTSYRSGLDEYVYRPPEDFLSDEFVERCNGLPLIFEHPSKSNILNTEEYRDRAIGTVILPYIKGDEVWGIAKVFDEDAAELMKTTHASTSPAVVFRDAGSTASIEIDGKTVLIEGKPSYLDHLAICEVGVWDKGGEPAGIINQKETIMADKEDVPAWADALMKRMDSMEVADKSRKDSEEKEKADIKADTEEKERKDAEALKDEKEKDDIKADSEEEKKREEEKADSAKVIAGMAAEIAAMNARLQPQSKEDRDALSIAQSRADGIAQMFGDSVNAPLHGESPIEYRKRLVEKFKQHSSEFKLTRLDSIDGAAFDLVEAKIYADAQAAAMSPAVATAGRLIPIVRRDSAGREITTYSGDPEAWMGAFKARPVSITSFNTKGV